ncbi:hypothetical protein AX14_004245 [Amanita brunnescens Koide BX004]|nr:hypothetical protein AX14_004245 [Amanita brunnescens Koide BX004]
MDTPERNSGRGGSTAPSTPTSERRARHSAGEPANNASPTSTYSESTETAFRLNDRSALHAVFATPFATPARKVVVRSDPSLLTCFDPADKELYDLWVPRR